MSMPDFQNTAQAVRQLQSLMRLGLLQEDAEALLPVLTPALRDSPDPDRASSAFGRWMEACKSPQDNLPALLTPGVLDRFCFITGSSQYFADLLAHTPDDFDVIIHPEEYGESETPARRHLEISRLVEDGKTLEQQHDILRRWKACKMLQIGARDLLGLDDMPTAAHEFSNIADACVQMALDMAYASMQETGGPCIHLIALPENPLAVFALGKLGGQELNYSSDIDLIFVHKDGLPPYTGLADGRRIETPVYLTRLAEHMLRTLSDKTVEGHVFRVDMRLRPEGRFGSLTRSLSGCRAYYERWAENWERQALLKARFVAGNRSLGAAFMDMVEPLIFRRQISGAFLNDIRHNKRRIEQASAKRGGTQTNIKTGVGGIRDIEFIVQLLQLEFGSRQPRLRSPNTLTALARLNEANYLTDSEAQELGDDYVWLRTLEHRLQLLHNAQTQILPSQDDEPAWTHLARRMRYATLDAFKEDLTRRRNRVRAYLDVLFYDQDRRFYPHFPLEPDPLWHDVATLLDALNTPDAQAALTPRLTQVGFRDAPSALRLLALLRHSEEFRDAWPQASELFRALAPYLLQMAGESPDPDAALAGIEMLAVPYRDNLYRLFRGRPDLMWRVIRLASVPPLIAQLARHQEWMLPLLGDDTEEAPPVEDTLDAPTEGQVQPDSLPHAAQSFYYVRQLEARIARLPNQNAQWKLIALFYQRERLRLAARDVWDEADVTDVMNGLTRLAEATLHVVLTVCGEARAQSHPDPPRARRMLAQVAIVALGRLGGGELNYGSDYDLLFVYDTERPRIKEEAQGERNALVSGLAQDVLAAVQSLNLHGANISIDLRLRPWGRKGNVIYATRGYLDYFAKHAQTWERQAALKARYVAGNARVGRRLERILRAVSGGRGVTEAEDREVEAMKARIEMERLAPVERDTDLKLGHGGLSDIEWLVQRLQLRYGPNAPAVRIPNTLDALDALEEIHALDRSEVGVLVAAYRLLTRARNAMTLLAGEGQDVFPADPIRRRVLARLLGYEDSLLLRGEEILQEALQSDMRAVRRIFERRFAAQDSSAEEG